MYSVTIKAGAPLVKPQYFNVLKFQVKFMHGDADAYSHETVYVRDIAANAEQINRYVCGLDFMSKDEFTELWSPSDQAAALLKFFDGNEDHRDEFADNFLKGDCTTDGSTYAGIDDVTITYFDATGLEHSVNCVFGENHD